MSNDDMVRAYLENAAEKDRICHIKNEQMAKNIIKGMNENKCFTPAVKTSDEEWEQLQQDIARGYVLR